jgi:DNA-directed RNA polymerase subunit RPC12/RpoP
VYRLGFSSAGANHGFSIYLTSLAEAFHITPAATYSLLVAAYFYLFAGSSALLVWRWLADTKEFLKIACPACGGHIAFPASGGGQQIDCPHCSARITLQKPTGKPA